MDTLRIDLDTGQTLHLALRRGDTLWVQRGQLSAQAPAEWLGDTLVLQRQTWHEAQTVELATRQTWHAMAQTPSTLVLHRRPGWLATCWAALRRLGGRTVAAQWPLHSVRDDSPPTVRGHRSQPPRPRQGLDS